MLLKLLYFDFGDFPQAIEGKRGGLKQDDIGNDLTDNTLYAL